jgi:hypothetical protein
MALPYIFSPNTIILSSQANANFAAVALTDLSNVSNTGTGLNVLQSGASINTPTITGATLTGSFVSSTGLSFFGTTNSVVLRAAAATSVYNFTLPPNAGTAGYVLATDGAGNTSWAAGGGGGGGGLVIGSSTITGGSTGYILYNNGGFLGNLQTIPVSAGGTGTSTTLSQGSVVFAGLSGTYSQNNAQFFWDNTNNRLGIGTNSPTTRLAIAGDSTTANMIALSDTATGGKSWGIGPSAGTANPAIFSIYDYTNSQSALGYTAGASGFWQFYTAGTEKMRIGTSGGVAIGSTDTTTAKLLINDTSTAPFYAVSDNAATVFGVIRNLNTANCAGLSLSSWSTWTTAKTVGQLRYDGLTSTGTYTEYAAIYASAGTNTANGAPTSLVFRTGDGSSITSSGEKMRLDQNGNLMVGISSSTAKFMASGTVVSGSVVSQVQNLDTGASSLASLTAYHGSTNSISVTAASGYTSVGTNGTAVNFVIGTTPAAPLLFNTTNTERMRIAASGQVAIGTTTTPAGSILSTSGGAIQSNGLGNIGQFEMPNGSASTWYNAGWRNDGSSTYLLVSDVQTTQAAAQTAVYNTSARPFAVNNNSQGVTIGPPRTATAALTITGLSAANISAFTVNGQNTGGSVTAAFADGSNPNGVNIALYGNGTTTQNKFLRVISGNLQWVNSVYGSVIWQMDDGGNTDNYGNFSVGTGATRNAEVDLFFKTNAISNFYWYNTGTAGQTLALAYCNSSGVFVGTSFSVDKTAGTVTFSSATNFSSDANFNGSYGPTSPLSIGYRGIPVNSPGGNYTGVLSDAGKTIVMPGGSTFTIPANSGGGSVAFPIGTTLTIINGNPASGNVAIAITTDTMYLANTAGTTGSRTLSPLGVATAIKTTATVWVISGNGLN